jgi:hypothetical protein
MAAGVKDLNVEQGAIFTLGLVWRQRAVPPATVGEPYDLTGATAHMQIRTRRIGGDVMADFDESDGIQLGGADGRLFIIIPSALTLTFARKRAFYDLYVTRAGLEPQRILQGSVLIDRTVTLPVEAP